MSYTVEFEYVKDGMVSGSIGFVDLPSAEKFVSNMQKHVEVLDFLIWESNEDSDIAF